MVNTLTDVARETGLSVAVVGRALGKYGSVSDEARKRALKAAREIDGMKAPQLVLDNEGGAQQAVNLFVRLGHRRIALVNLSSSVSPLRDRFEGYKRGLKENGVPFHPELVRYIRLQQEEICQLIRELVNTRNSATALIVAENLLVTEVLLALKKYTIKIPTRIAIIGFGESRWCPPTDPPLTTVSIPAYSIGKMLCETLLRRMKELSKDPRRAKDLCEKIVIPMKFTIRKSHGEKLT